MGLCGNFSQRNGQHMENMWKMFSANKSTVYFDKIGELLEKYNNSCHNSVKMTPAEASEIKNSSKFLLINIQVKFTSKIKT